MKILVTGAGGYIGSVATYLLLQNGHSVVGLDNFVNGYTDPLKLLQGKFGSDKLTYYKKDIREDLEEIFKRQKFDAVLHYAALCKVNESMEEPGKYFNNNFSGTQNLIEAMLRHSVKKIVFSSTCAIYGDPDYSPLDEKHPARPVNPYGESKYLVERMLRWYSDIKELKYVILRYFNVCGASDDGSIGDSKKPSVLLVQNAVRGALGIETFSLTCSQFDTPDGTPIRDYVNVVDLNEAHLKALEYLKRGGKSEIINIGTGNGNSVLEVVNTVQKVTGKKFEVGKTTPRKGEYAEAIANTKKAKEVLVWSAKRTIEDSITSLVKWYKDHPNGWDK